ncbi:MAG: sporulation integral membrane protein YtvI, partial [Lachnospiraceae bacterium]|nr:sporulation integral membrane protein YtvI [Lachnospiraceae bacterium]
MKKSTLYVKALVNVVFYIIAAVLVAVFVPKLIIFFLPFVIGWIVAAIANPAIKFFEEKIKFKRKASSAIFIVLILAIIILALYGIIVFLINQGIGF